MTERAQCSRCGAVFTENNQFCTQCGAPVPRRAFLAPTPVQGRARPARFSQLALALLVDVVMVVVLVGVLLFIGITANDINVWVVCVIVFAIAVAAHVHTVLFTGQSVSARIAGIRLISSVTGSAPGTRLASLRLMDVRKGEDPIEPQMPPYELALGTRDVVRHAASAAPHKKGWVLVIDEERRVALTGSFVVGRNPAVVAGETALAIPDLGRLLSKGHLRFDIDAEGTVFVTDLGSTNGSQIDSATLAPHQRVVITSDVRIHAGDHIFRVENRARTLQEAV